MKREQTIGIEQIILIDYLGEDEYYKLNPNKINKISSDKLIVFTNVSEVVSHYFELIKTHKGFKRLNTIEQMVKKIYSLKEKDLNNLLATIKKDKVILIKGIGEEPLFFGYKEVKKRKDVK